MDLSSIICNLQNGLQLEPPLGFTGGKYNLTRVNRALREVPHHDDGIVTKTRVAVTVLSLRTTCCHGAVSLLPSLRVQLHKNLQLKNLAS